MNLNTHAQILEKPKNVQIITQYLIAEDKRLKHIILKGETANEIAYLKLERQQKKDRGLLVYPEITDSELTTESPLLNWAREKWKVNYNNPCPNKFTELEISEVVNAALIIRKTLKRNDLQLLNKIEDNINNNTSKFDAYTGNWKNIELEFLSDYLQSNLKSSDFSWTNSIYDAEYALICCAIHASNEQVETQTEHFYNIIQAVESCSKRDRVRYANELSNMKYRDIITKTAFGSFEKAKEYMQSERSYLNKLVLIHELSSFNLSNLMERFIGRKNITMLIDEHAREKVHEYKIAQLNKTFANMGDTQ